MVPSCAASQCSNQVMKNAFRVYDQQVTKVPAGNGSLSETAPAPAALLLLRMEQAKAEAEEAEVRAAQVSFPIKRQSPGFASLRFSRCLPPAFGQDTSLCAEIGCCLLAAGTLRAAWAPSVELCTRQPVPCTIYQGCECCLAPGPLQAAQDSFEPNRLALEKYEEAKGLAEVRAGSGGLGWDRGMTAQRETPP